MNNFFLTGLPRSRTAWLAAYLTNPSKYTYCYHEALNGLRSRDEFTEIMEGPIGGPLFGGVARHPWIKVGNSDSGLMYTDFQERFPDAPVVIILRPYEDVVNSFRHKGLGLNPDEPMRELLDTTRQFIDAIVLASPARALAVNYEDIDERLEEICTYINVPYDYHRHQLFKELNIQTKELTGDPESLKLWLK